jgi:hypothetical protein
MNKKAITLTFLFSTAIITGCVTDVANRYYADQTYAAKPVQDVHILSTKPKEPFIVIADFQSRGESGPFQDVSFVLRSDIRS